jgi:hypothetical protein
MLSLARLKECKNAYFRSRSDRLRTVYSRKRRIKLLAVALASFLVVASTHAGELRALCSAAKDFVSAGKAQEGILITYPTPTEFSASTIAYAAAKKRYIAELRSVMPILIAIGLKQRPKDAEVEEFRSVFQEFGDDEEQRVAKATLEMLKQFDNDQAVATAEKEFNLAQEMEAAFVREYGVLSAT